MEALGLGCIWFALKPEAGDFDSFSPRKHLDDIRSALELVDNVSNVRVHGKGNAISGVLMNGGDDEETENYFPIYADVRIEFDIFVPTRLQEKYGLWRTADSVETFHVKINYDEMPIAYIHYTVDRDATNLRELSPSAAVIFIRKYLAEKLSSHPIVDFQVLGPSPFHADLFIEPARGDIVPGTTEDLTRPGDGYRTLHFFTEGQEPNDTINEFIFEYQKVLSSYYSVVRERNLSYRLTANLGGGAIRLLNPTVHAGPWHRFRRWYGLRGQIDSLFQSLIDSLFQSLLKERMNRVQLASFFAKVKEDEEISKDNIFYRFIQEAARLPEPLPDEDIRELLIMLEERRRGYFQNTTTWASVLIGGLLGAALTYALSPSSTSGTLKESAISAPEMPTTPKTRN